MATKCWLWFDIGLGSSEIQTHWRRTPQRKCWSHGCWSLELHVDKDTTIIWVEAGMTWILWLTRWVIMFRITHLNCVSTISLTRRRETKVDKNIWFFYDRRNGVLMLLLHNHGKNVRNRRQRVHEQDLGANNRKWILQPF